jgi:hypothetical protein
VSVTLYTKVYAGTHSLSLSVGVAGDRRHLLHDLALHEYLALLEIAVRDRSGRSGEGERKAHDEAGGELPDCGMRWRCLINVVIG